MSTAEYLTAVAEGLLPNSPAIALLGMRLKSFSDGSAEIAFDPDEVHLNFAGIVHGGVISAVLDTCIGYAVNTTLKAGEIFSTVQINVQFIRSVRAEQKTLRARADVRHRGGRIAAAEAFLEGADGKLCATATASLLIKSGASAQSP